MIITICGSMKFYDKMLEAKRSLEALEHDVLMPIKGVQKNKTRAELKIDHLDRIDRSDAILVINITKNDIENYIGGSTFLEIGFAHYKAKKIFFLNPIPDQPYIIDNISIVEPQVINRDYSKVLS